MDPITPFHPTLTNPLVLKMLSAHSMTIIDMCRLRVLCRATRDAVDHLWELMKTILVNRITTQRNINVVLLAVAKNKELVKFVCDQICLKNGHVLSEDGAMVSSVIIGEHNDPEITALIERLVKAKLNTTNRAMSSVLFHIKRFDLTSFRRAMRKFPNNDTLLLSTIQLAALSYFKAFLESSVRDYQIDWDKLAQWDKTDMWDYLHRALVPKDYVILFKTFLSLAKETQKRNKQEIIEFITRYIDPMIEFERDLLAQLTNTQIPFEAIDLGMYANERTTTRDKTVKVVMGCSIIREILPAASTSPEMFAKYYKIADAVFDISSDPILQDCIKMAVTDDTTVIVDLISRGYTFNISSELIHMYANGLLPLPELNLEQQEPQPEEDANNQPPFWQVGNFPANGPIPLRADPQDNLYHINQAVEVQKTLNSTAIFKLYLLHDEFSDDLICPVTNQSWVDFTSQFSDCKWILARTEHSVERCKARLLYMEERRWFDAIVRCFEIFPTSDLEFWQDFWECYGDQILACNDGGFFEYHMKTLNVDFLRWWLPRVDPSKYVDRRSTNGNAWVGDLAKELFPDNDQIQKINAESTYY